MNIKKWKYVYFGLALLDVVAVGTSLIINHHLGSQYSEAIQVSEFWATRLEAIEDLQVLASQVNAPGNDVFDSHDTKKERERFSAAIEKYSQQYNAALEDLKSHREDYPLEKAISSYEAIQIKMDEMIKATNKIFSYFESNQRQLAGSRMATMDQKYALLRQTLTDCSKEIRKIQIDDFHRQKEVAERLQLFEMLFAVFIATMIAGIVAYGTVMSKFITRSFQEKKMADEQKKALDAAAIVAITDTVGKITYANEKFFEIAGYKSEEIVGKDHRIINSGHHPKEFFRDLWKTISSGVVWRGEVKNKRKDGTYYWVDSAVVPMKNEKDQITQYIAIRHEITERKFLEESLTKAKDEAIAARAEADAATQAKARFLANMSHEIRTPMNGIIGMSNLLLSNITDPVGIERLKIIQSCGNSLLDLINDVLDFSKLEVDKVELERHPFPIHDTAKEIVDLLNTRASEKGVTLSYKHGKGVPDWLLGDATRFRQILTNLVGNAIKFTEIGSVEVSSQAKSIEDKKWQIQFAVKDTGMGIPNHIKDRLFRSFSQVDASTTRRFGGTGLGLAICKGLCEKMGGSIWVESEMGKGSTFFFTFTGEIAAPLESQKSPNPFAAFDPEMGKKQPLRVLVAEDNPTNQLVAVGLLGKLGYEADVAGNGREALKALKTQQYDLILMDCHMPEVDGFQATKRILEVYGEQRPRIVALTASIMKEDIDQCAASGMDGFLGKPITLASLVKTLGECQPTSQRKGGTNMSDVRPLPFDRQTFMENFQDMEDLAVEAIKSFLSTLPSLVAAIDDAVRSENAAELELAAHTLKGTVSNFYAEPSELLAWKLEQIGHARTTMNANKVFLELKVELERLHRAFDSLLNERKAA